MIKTKVEVTVIAAIVGKITKTKTLTTIRTMETTEEMVEMILLLISASIGQLTRQTFHHNKLLLRNLDGISGTTSLTGTGIIRKILALMKISWYLSMSISAAGNLTHLLI
jgi:hypothetical protein